MRDSENIVKAITEIYREGGIDAQKYLHKARKLKVKFGPGLAIVYCWFYSVPQKWAKVEPKIFELMEHADFFDLETMSQISREELATMLKPTIFPNELALQLKNFCKAIQLEYDSWESFAKAIENNDIFSILKKLRKYRGIRLTFKNLAAMKSFVGMSNDFIILDTHVAKVLGICKSERSKYCVQEKLFKNLLIFSKRITHRLQGEVSQELTAIQWSLAIWFDKAKLHANDLLAHIKLESSE